MRHPTPEFKSIFSKVDHTFVIAQIHLSDSLTQSVFMTTIKKVADLVFIDISISLLTLYLIFSLQHIMFSFITMFSPSLRQL